MRVWIESSPLGLRRIVVVPSASFMARAGVHARASGCTVSQLVYDAIAGMLPREQPLPTSDKLR